jgi:hypothetical protein
MDAGKEGLSILFPATYWRGLSEHSRREWEGLCGGAVGGVERGGEQ